MNRLLFILWTLSVLATTSARAQFDYETNADNTLTIVDYLGTNDSVTVPSTIDGLPVTQTADSAFYRLTAC